MWVLSCAAERVPGLTTTQTFLEGQRSLDLAPSFSQQPPQNKFARVPGSALDGENTETSEPRFLTTEIFQSSMGKRRQQTVCQVQWRVEEGRAAGGERRLLGPVGGGAGSQREHSGRAAELTNRV